MKTRTSLRRSLALVAAAFATLAGSGSALAQTPAGSPQSAVIRRPLPDAAAVHGSIVYSSPPPRGSKNKRAQQILLPSIEVFLHNLVTNEDSGPVKSDMLGNFEFPGVKNGRYELRWKAQNGWAAGVFPKPLVVNGFVAYAHPVQMKPDKDLGVITGSVQMADGTTPWFYSEVHGVVKAATVGALNASTNRELSKPTLANFAGLFAIPGLDRAAPLKLAATLEGAKMEAPLPVGILSASPTAAPVIIKLKSHRPRVVGINASLNGATLRNAAPAAVVNVKATAEDVDGDTLTYKWTTDQGTFSGSGPAVDWKLPDQPGSCTLTVLVTDGMGGATTQTFSFDVVRASEQGNVQFRGVVVDPRGTPIPKAQVSVNGKTTASDRDGRFALAVPDGKQFVLNIKRPGFALRSCLLERPVTQQWILVPTQVQRVDAGRDMEIVDLRPEAERKKLKGTIRVASGTLVDLAGNKASGTIRAEIATLDIANNEMPGDFLAVDRGAEVGLTSFGALWVEFTNSANQKLQLAPGSSAKVSIGVPPVMRASAPAKMPVWSYDEADGRWKPSGKANLNGARDAYEGTVTHFSTINMDQPGDVSCVRVHTDVGLPAGLTLRVRDAPGNPNPYAQVKSMKLAGELNKTDGPLNAVWRLPANRTAKFEILNDAGVDVSEGLHPMVIVEDGETRLTIGTRLANNIVTAGPNNTDLWPAYPYAACKPVTLKLFPRWGSYPGSSFLLKKAPLPGEPGNVATEASAAAYNTAVDPNGLRPTLGAWWGLNGFNPANGSPAPAAGEPVTNYARTSYLNNNDLGSGRDMHFHKSPTGDLAAFVTNYSRNVAFDQRAEFADDAADGAASAASNPGATVCMEFKAVEGSPATRIVKFFVYAGNGNGPAAVKQTKANLDGFGDRFLPGLCINCHGYGSSGGYNNPLVPSFADVDIGCSFRELDLATYHFPAARTTPNAAEEDATRLQNLMIRDTGAARGPVLDLINGWYASSATQDNNGYTPQFWRSPDSGSTLSKNLYHDVVKVSCRTCHIAFNSAPGDSFGIDWNRYDQLANYRGFGLIDALVTGSNWTAGNQRIMPHALVTYRNFWLQTTVAPNPNGSRAQRLWEYQDATLGTNGNPIWPAVGPPSDP